MKCINEGVAKGRKRRKIEKTIVEKAGKAKWKNWKRKVGDPSFWASKKGVKQGGGVVKKWRYKREKWHTGRWMFSGKETLACRKRDRKTSKRRTSQSVQFYVIFLTI